MTEDKGELDKDRILKLYQLPLLRLPTNGSGEKEKILNKLQEILVRTSN